MRRVIGELEGIEQQQDPIFASPRDVLLDLVLATHELEAAVMKMRKAWWAPVLLLAIVLMATPSLAVVPHRIPHLERPHKFNTERPPEQTIKCAQ